MAKNAYIGVSSVARHVKGIYVGVSNVARKVKAGWVGVNGVARQFYASDWWLPSGVAAANCLAAYQFKGAASETAALKKVNTGTAYNLTKTGESPTWTTANGFWIPAWGGLDNTTLRAIRPLAIVARFSGATSTANRASVISGGFGTFTNTGTRYEQALFLRTPYTTQSFAYRYTDALGGQYARAESYTTNGIRSSTDKSTSGVVGISFSDTAITLYKNGTKLTVSIPSYTSGSTTYDMSGGPNTFYSAECGYILIGMRTKNTSLTTWNRAEAWTWAGYYLQAIAFYSVALTAAQHKEVADAMNAL